MHVSLLGSFARREAGPDSDIDAMVIVGDDVDTHGNAWTDQVQELQEQVLAWTGNRFEPLVCAEPWCQHDRPSVTPRRLRTRAGDAGQARSRRIIAGTYLETAELVATEDGAAVNVSVGLAVLAGIAAGDAICIAGSGERYAGTDHAAAADLLARVDAEMGRRLRRLIALKSASHHGERLLDIPDRLAAVRDAAELLAEAVRRTT